MLLGALLLASIVPIAPLQPTLGDLPFFDVLPRAATDGATTLVVWYDQAPFAETGNVYGIFTQADGSPIGSSFEIAPNGSAPRVASNGDEYLVAYGVPLQHPIPVAIPIVGLRTVQRDGTLGGAKTIGSSSYTATVTAVVWAGDHWIVAYSDTAAHIAFLTRRLEPYAPAIDLPSHATVALVSSGSHVYAFQSPGPNLNAYEITGGTTTLLASTPMQASLILAAPTPNGAIVVARHAFETLDVLTFSPSTGWSAPVPINAGTPYDLAPSGNNSLLLTGPSRGGVGALIGTTLNASGAVVDTQTLAPAAGSASLVGSLLLVSDGKAILSNGQVLSLTRTDVQTNPIVVSAGSYAMAFWNQSIDAAGTLRTFSRKIDVSGQPAGDPNELPFTMADAAHAAFDGTQFILTWNGGKLVTVTADGKTAGDVITIYPPFETRVAAANGNRFAVWNQYQEIIGSPMLADARPAVQQGIVLLPSIRPQADPDLAVLASGFICVWTEDTDIGAMALSAQGTPSHAHTIGSGTHPLVAGDSDSALAGWLTPAGSPVFVPFAADGSSFDLFDPHWGGGFATLRLTSAGVASRYFAGLIKDGALLIGETGQQGSFMTAISPLQYVAPVSGAFSIAGVEGHAVAAWEADRRVFVGTPEMTRRRLIHH